MRELRTRYDTGYCLLPMSGLRRLLDTVRALWPFRGEAWVEPSNAITRMLDAGAIQLSPISLDDIPMRATAAAAAKVLPTAPAAQPAAAAATAATEAPARPGRAA